MLGGLAAYILGSIAALVTVLYEDMACIRIRVEYAYAYRRLYVYGPLASIERYNLPSKVQLCNPQYRVIVRTLPGSSMCHYSYPQRV